MNNFQNTNMSEISEFEEPPISELFEEHKTTMNFGNMMKIKESNKNQKEKKQVKNAKTSKDGERYQMAKVGGKAKVESKALEAIPEGKDLSKSCDWPKGQGRAATWRGLGADGFKSSGICCREDNEFPEGDEDVKFSITPKVEHPREINNVHNDRRKVKKKGKVTVDSGAEASVWPASSVSWENVYETDDSAKGIGFVAANGSRMENYGGTQVKFEKDGKLKAMDFQVTDCKKPLASVAKIIDRGNRVVFDKDESYILNKATGEKIMLERERGTFVMVVEFEMDEDENTTSCFRRHA